MDQFAYLKRHSTPTNLDHIIKDLLENFNDGAITDARLLDIIQRLDSINQLIC